MLTFGLSSPLLALVIAFIWGLTVVAEGVETLPTAQTLTALGCDELQGYCFSRPLPAPEFLAWASEHHVPNERRRVR